MLAVLILVHELGHLIAAKLFGVRVEEFGIGFPPRLIGIRRGETLYSLNAIPLGGFTRMVGEEDPQLPRSLASKSPGARFLVLSAGSLMNVLLPIILFAIAFMIPHQVLQEEVQIMEVTMGSPAARADIEPGDRILKINDHPIRNRGDVFYRIHLSLGSDMSMLLQKSDLTQREVVVRPRWNPPQGQGATGITIEALNSATTTHSYHLWEAVPRGALMCWETMILFRNEVRSWFIRGMLPQMMGPIGIAQLTGEVAKEGVSPLLKFAALISINLAIINLLPIPGLDGGRLVFVALEWVRRGRRISPQREGLIHFIGFVVLIMAISVISYYDVVRLVQGESLLP